MVFVLRPSCVIHVLTIQIYIYGVSDQDSQRRHSTIGFISGDYASSTL